MDLLKYMLAFAPFLLLGQTPAQRTPDTTLYDAVRSRLLPEVEGLTRDNPIHLGAALILPRLGFKTRKDYVHYLILQRKTRKVYPYAKLAAEHLDSLERRLEKIHKKRRKRRYTKQVQKYIEGKFSKQLKKMTRTEGQILVKLIYRQTGHTTFSLVKELRSGWRAFWYKTTASMFNISLKATFDPFNNRDDYLIEDILLRSFQNGSLEPQEAAVKFDYYQLLEKWGAP